MNSDAHRRLAGFVDEALDWTVLPGYTKLGDELREGLLARGAPGRAGKRAIVTGATSGIGEAACVGLARGGAEVHLVVRNLEKGAEAKERVGGGGGGGGE